MKKTLTPVWMALVALVCSNAHADSPASAGIPKKDDILQASVTALPLYQATPDPSFGGKAAQTGWIRKGEAVKVLETKQYFSMLGMELWIEVAKESDANVKGWVMAGMSREIARGRSNLVIQAKKAEAAPEAEAHKDAEAHKEPEAISRSPKADEEI